MSKYCQVEVIVYKFTVIERFAIRKTKFLIYASYLFLNSYLRNVTWRKNTHWNVIL